MGWASRAIANRRRFASAVSDTFAEDQGAEPAASYQFTGPTLENIPGDTLAERSRAAGALATAESARAFARGTGEQIGELGTGIVESGRVAAEAGAGETARTVGGMLGRGALRGAALVGEVVPLAQEAVDRIVPAGQRPPSLYRSTVRPALEDLAKRIPVDEAVSKTLVFGKVPEAIGQSAPFYLTGTLGVPATMLTGAVVNGRSAYEEALARGKSADEARKIGLVNGLMGISESAPVAALFNRFGGKAKLLKSLDEAPSAEAAKAILDKIGDGRLGRAAWDTFAQVVEEGGQEAAQQAVQNVTMGDPAGKGLVESAFLGAASGGVMGGAGAVVGEAKLARDAGRAAPAVEALADRERTDARFKVMLNDDAPAAERAKAAREQAAGMPKGDTRGFVLDHVVPTLGAKAVLGEDGKAFVVKVGGESLTIPKGATLAQARARLDEFTDRIGAERVGPAAGEDAALLEQFASDMDALATREGDRVFSKTGGLFATPEEAQGLIDRLGMNATVEPSGKGYVVRVQEAPAEAQPADVAPQPAAAASEQQAEAPLPAVAPESSQPAPAAEQPVVPAAAPPAVETPQAVEPASAAPAASTAEPAVPVTPPASPPPSAGPLPGAASEQAGQPPAGVPPAPVGGATEPVAEAPKAQGGSDATTGTEADAGGDRGVGGDGVPDGGRLAGGTGLEDGDTDVVDIPLGLEPGGFPPPLRITRAAVTSRSFPAPTDPGARAIYDRLAAKLLPHQRQGAAMAFAAIERVGGFLMADGTGSGKTSQILALSEMYRAGMGKRVVVFAPNEVLGKPGENKGVISGSYVNDAKRMGVPIKWVEKAADMKGDFVFVTTYDKMKSGGFEKAIGGESVVVFDEAHRLKNVQAEGSKGASETARVGMVLGQNAYGLLAATATPGDKPHHMLAFLRTGMLEGNSVEAQMQALGMRYVKPRDEKKPGKWVATSDVDVRRKVAELFTRMTAAGAMLKREIDMTGLDVRFVTQDAPAGWQRVEDLIYEARGGYAGGGLRQFPRMLKARVMGDVRRAQETFKVDRAVKIIKEDIAAGRQVVVFASRVNESEVKVKRRGPDGEPYFETVYSSEGTLKLLRERMKAEGITYAELHGASEDPTASEAQRRFQSGEAQVVLATVESGGTGINLDDTEGNRPRSVLMLTAPFGATENVQALGRVHRLTTRSRSRVTYLFYRTDIDAANAMILRKKLNFLGAMVSGGVENIAADPDLLDLMEEGEDTGEVAQAQRSESSTAELRMEPAGDVEFIDRAGNRVRRENQLAIKGRTLQNKERIKRIPGATWNVGLGAWLIDAGMKAKAEAVLGALLEEGSDKRLPGARTFPAFVSGILAGEVVPGRSTEEAEAVKRAAAADGARSPGTPEHDLLRAYHRRFVREAVLAGYPIQPAVAAEYPEVVQQAHASRLSRAEAAALSDLIATGIARPAATDAVLQAAVEAGPAPAKQAAKAEQAARKARRKETGTPTPVQQEEGSTRLSGAERALREAGDWHGLALMQRVGPVADRLLAGLAMTDGEVEALAREMMTSGEVSYRQLGDSGPTVRVKIEGSAAGVRTTIVGDETYLTLATKDASGAPILGATKALVKTHTAESLAAMLRETLRIPRRRAVVEPVTKAKAEPAPRRAEPQPLGAGKVIFGAQAPAHHPGRVTQRLRHRYAVVSVDALIPSHRLVKHAPGTLDGNLEAVSDYPSDLQPRTTRSIEDVVKRARAFNAESALAPSPLTDYGPPVIDGRGVVLSGNGRMASLLLAREAYPDQWKAYQEELRRQTSPEADIHGLRLPNNLHPGALEGEWVLVRVYEDTEQTPFEYARLANGKTSEESAARDSAREDARRITDTTLEEFTVATGESVEQALAAPKAARLRQEVLGALPGTERGTYLGEDGKPTEAGTIRLKAALLAKAYTGEFGKGLVDLFTGTATEMAVATERAILESIAVMAKGESLVADGLRKPEAAVAEDVAWTVQKLADIRAAGSTVKAWLAGLEGGLGLIAQAAASEGLTSRRQALLEIVEASGKSSAALAGALKKIGQAVVDSEDPTQASFFGVPTVDVDAVIEQTLTEVRRAMADKRAKRSVKDDLLKAGEEAGRRLEEHDEGGWLRLDAFVPKGTPPPAQAAEAFERGLDRRDEGPGLAERMKGHAEAIRRIWYSATRKFEAIPRGKYGEFQEKVRILSHQPAVQADIASRALTGLLANLNSDQRRTYSAKAALDDFMFDIEMGSKTDPHHRIMLPFFEQNHEAAIAKWWEYTAKVEADPAVQRALEQRRALYDEVRGDLIREAEGLNMKSFAERFSNPYYYRHDVLREEEARESARRRGVKTPEGRGMYLRRKGTAIEIDLDAVAVDHRVLMTMMYDVEMLRFIKWLGKHDALGIAKAEAKRVNREIASEMWKDAADKYNASKAVQEGTKPPRTPTEMMDAVLNSLMGYGFRSLEELAAEGALPDGDGQWTDVVGDIAAGERTESLFPYLSWLMKEETADLRGKAAAAAIFKGIREKNKAIADAVEAAGLNVHTWRDATPKGYRRWDYHNPEKFFRAMSVDERLVKHAVDQGMATLANVPVEQVRTVVARAVQNQFYLLPNEIADTLDDLAKNIEEGVAEFYMGRAMGWWKGHVLTFLPAITFYNLRNFAGDLEGVAVANPGALRYLGKAAVDLYPAFLTRRGRDPQNEALARFMYLSGLSGGLIGQEFRAGAPGTQSRMLTDTQMIEEAIRLNDAELSRTDPANKAWRFVKQVIWPQAPTAYREALLRYAAFLDYKEQIDRNGGNPDNYGASDRREVDDISDPWEKAYKLSNEVLVAYDALPKPLQRARRAMLPFVSFKVGNIQRWAGIYRNIYLDARDGKIASGVAKSLGLPAGVALSLLSSAMRFTALVTLVSAASHVWNLSMFPDEEDELDEETRSRTHLILPGGEPGKPNVLTRIGTLDDVLATFGFEWAPALARDTLNNLLSPQDAAQVITRTPADTWNPDKSHGVAFLLHVAREQARRTGKAVVNAAAETLGPLYKAPMEMLFGMELYPDATSPRPLRDPYAVYLARQVGLAEEARLVDGMLSGRPGKEYLSPLKRLFSRTVDTDLGAFWDYDRLARAWYRDKYGHGAPVVSRWSEEPKSQALVNYHLAARYGLKEQMDLWAERYGEEGGTMQGLKASIRGRQPLAAWMRKEDLAEFEAAIADDPAAQRLRDRAWRYWESKYD